MNSEVLPKIDTFRDKPVMLDADLAALYEVDTKQFNRAIKRNLQHFPPDFGFQVTAEEFENLRCQTDQKQTSNFS